MASKKISRFDRLYTEGSGLNVIGRSKLWYGITVGLVIVAFLAMLLRGFNLSIDFEGGTTVNMPAADLVATDVADTFEEATGVTPEIAQVVGSGDSATLEVTSERLSQEQTDAARQAIYDKYQPVDQSGKATPDAIGVSTVSESWGSSITQRMLLAMIVFLAVATVYVAVRLQRSMAFAAIFALIVDAVIIAGIYALCGFEVSPASSVCSPSSRSPSTTPSSSLTRSTRTPRALQASASITTRSWPTSPSTRLSCVRFRRRSSRPCRSSRCSSSPSGSSALVLSATSRSFSSSASSRASSPRCSSPPRCSCPLPIAPRTSRPTMRRSRRSALGMVRTQTPSLPMPPRAPSLRPSPLSRTRCPLRRRNATLAPRGARAAKRPARPSQCPPRLFLRSTP